MDRHTLAPVSYTIDVGDRVTLRRPRLAYARLIDRVGTVVEVFRAPLDSCLVRLDEDVDREREWFFYRDEVVILAESTPLPRGLSRKVSL